MFIIFSTIDGQNNLIGHVGSNKYRAAAQLKEIVDTWIKDWCIKNKKNYQQKIVKNTKEVDNSTEIGIFTTLSDNERIVYLAYEIETGWASWVRSVKQRLVKEVARFNMQESKFIDNLKPDDDSKNASNSDNMLKELKKVISARKSDQI